MTRENKLALVIGFGLILFVGILVSDHFSSARFDPVDVTQASNASPSGEVVIQGIGPEVNLAPNGAAAGVPAGGEGKIELASNDRPLEVGTVDKNGNVTVEEQRADGAPVRFHKVQKGDTYWSIAAREYGDGSLATKLQEYNKAAAPDAARLTLGADLRIPAMDVLRPGAAPRSEGTAIAQTKPADPVASRAIATYTIQKGDTPYRIAKDKGVKLAELLSYNGIKDPSALKPGQTLKIPNKY